VQSLIKTYIADANILILEGLKNILNDTGRVDIVGSATDGERMLTDITRLRPEVLLVDYTGDQIVLSDVLMAMKRLPSLRVIGIVGDCDVDQLKQLMATGLNGHLMNDCDRDEVVDAVEACAKGEKFFCGKVLDRLNASTGEETAHGCEPVNISERELEILQLIAEGLTTKQIAERLHLSFHTVMTHRKNMMGKLGLKNTAGLIVYAVRENLISPNRFLFSSDAKP
jgi:DNA-binding NarL/FixJ family response regulator